MVVYVNGSSHCFACGYHTHPKFYIPKPEKIDGPKSALPIDFSREVPTSGYQWLLQYGLPYSYWKPHTGYSEENGKRLVFTVGHPVAFSIGRLLSGEGRKWYVWGNSHAQCSSVGTGDVVVLVEDLISQHKVGQITESIALFGTTIHPCHYEYLLTQKKPVVMWLDKDQEALMPRKAMRAESILGIPVRTITTEEDPKNVSFEEITRKIYG